MKLPPELVEDRDLYVNRALLVFYFIPFPYLLRFPFPSVGLLSVLSDDCALLDDLSNVLSAEGALLAVRSLDLSIDGARLCLDEENSGSEPSAQFPFSPNRWT